MPPQLLALTEGPSILLDKPILLLGRHQECDIQLVSRKVSRRHCCIAQVEDYLVVRDLGSTNGIRINGVRVLEGKLKPGDELTIGNYRYQVTWDAVAAPAGRPARSTAVRQEPAAPIPRSVLEDDLLESCDMPVPLPEGPVRNRSRQTEKPPEPSDPDIEVPDSPVPEPRSRILPDEIELAPASKDLPPPHEPPPPPPG